MCFGPSWQSHLSLRQETDHKNEGWICKGPFDQCLQLRCGHCVSGKTVTGFLTAALSCTIFYTHLVEGFCRSRIRPKSMFLRGFCLGQCFSITFVPDAIDLIHHWSQLWEKKFLWLVLSKLVSHVQDRNRYCCTKQVTHQSKILEWIRCITENGRDVLVLSLTNLANMWSTILLTNLSIWALMNQLSKYAHEHFFWWPHTNL